MWQFERQLFNRGIKRIAGVDEAGRGPLAGPVVAAAVIVPGDCTFTVPIRDSKKMTASQREKAYGEIRAKCLCGCALVQESEIDKINILQAALGAMTKAVAALPEAPEWVLVDGNHKPSIPVPVTLLIAGESKSISIACASIIAKVVRDRIMVCYDKLYPVYGFASHKGYGTKQHCRAIASYGPSPIHRRSFKPVKSFV